MEGFMLKDGDLSITNDEIDMVNGNELTAQTIQSVISTNKGEWIFDTDEGVNFDTMLGKRTPNDDVIKSEIEDAVAQVDDSLTVDNFATDFDSNDRRLTAHFTAKTANDEDMNIKVDY